MSSTYNSPPSELRSEVSHVSDDDASLHVDLDRSEHVPNEHNAENLDLKNETRKTSVIRCLVITTLLTSAAIASNVALIMALNEEEIEFKAEYKRLSGRVVDRFLEAFGEKISAADSLVSSLSFENDVDTVNLSIPEFEIQADGIRQLSSSTTAAFSPILVGTQERQSWESYALESYDESLRSQFESIYLPHDAKYNFESSPLVTYRETGGRAIEDGIYRVDSEQVVTDTSSEMFVPVWQIAPFNDKTQSSIMFNQVSEMGRKSAIETVLSEKGYVVSDVLTESTTDSLHKEYAAPVMSLYYPVFRNIVRDKTVVGVITLEIGLESLLENILQGHEDEPLSVVIETSCGAEVSFLVRGAEVSYLGEGNLKESIPNVGAFEREASEFEQFDDVIKSLSSLFPTTEAIPCSYRVMTFPTNEFYAQFLTNRPGIIQALVGGIFLFTVAVILGYDCLVERRQRRALAAAQKTNDLVSSLFPQGVRDRLYLQAANKGRQLEVAPKHRLRNFMAVDNRDVGTAKAAANGTEPIADLFPNATVLFADISGFSAWASEREPSQVFTLLETMFSSFDTIARRLGVFKVETVGDCYVAATGIPEARDDHALTMVRFANAMFNKANELAKALESTLGPGTGDLTVRIGIHSGPVTAGVLRGEKSRFQLFGDTMNSASRMESTSVRGRIQLSADTAMQIIEAGKDHWIEPREETVDVKGKGKMQTYWLIPQKKEGDARVSLALQQSTVFDLDQSERIEANERLIDWNLSVMMSLIEKIIARRGRRRGSRTEASPAGELQVQGKQMLEEVAEVVHLAQFDCQAVLRLENSVLVPPKVRTELRDYISQISALYLDNPFHNFSHASHVIMSSAKMLKRIAKPEEVNYSHSNAADLAQELHDASYGISSDPLTQLAVLMSALIHDAGHTGVPNGQLAKEHPQFTAKYGVKSLAEQRSLEMSLELLDAPCYANLRACLFPLDTELQRFRQLVINIVLATDIFDKDLGELRKARWTKAFGDSDSPKNCLHEDGYVSDRRATIVLEHVMQASDVAHTMQHWKIYQKWNHNLFEEMFKAYKEGRSDRDPSAGWYKGELWFFDNYVIPLAKKLKECGAFGISSDEYLHYALENRAEWERKGEAIVEAMKSDASAAEMQLIANSNHDDGMRAATGAVQTSKRNLFAG